jgi:ADP-heptose:LPS heptosyltransferase
MSNILIIKHGSLGDIAQISGAIQDIKENHPNDKVFVLTTYPYEELFLKSPYIDEVYIDQRLSRLNLFYLLKLKQMISKLSLVKIYDLQNSSRTSFYRKFLFNKIKWSSAETTLPPGTNKSDFDNDPVLERFNFQLTKSNIVTKHTLKPNFSWACENIDDLLKKYNLEKYILLFPFCSINLPHKKWPYYNDLILLIKKHNPEFELIIAPSSNEIEESKKISARAILKDDKALTITQLAGLIDKAQFIISNDTGPAHMAAHLGTKGITLFGQHTTPKKVSIETNKFKAIIKDDLKELSAEEVYSNISEELLLV